MINTLITTALTVLVSATVGGAITYITVVGRLVSRVRDLEKWRGYVQEDTVESAEERKILLRSVLACLYGLREQGCNGPVSDGIKALEGYLDEQAHKVKSRPKESGTA